MDRCALFVDAGYLLADGAMAVHGTRHRETVSWDFGGLLQLLGNLARERTGMPLLRCYWYEATVEGRRAPEHEALSDLPGLKLRLGRIRPGRREGVDTEIHRDLMTLSRNGAIADAVVVSGDEDLAQVIADAQDLGVRATVVHVAVDGNWTISRVLRQECDDLIEIGSGHLRPYVNLLAGLDHSAASPLSNGHGAGSGGQIAPLRTGPHTSPPPGSPITGQPQMPATTAGSAYGGSGSTYGSGSAYDTGSAYRSGPAYGTGTGVPAGHGGAHGQLGQGGSGGFGPGPSSGGASSLGAGLGTGPLPTSPQAPLSSAQPIHAAPTPTPQAQAPPAPSPASPQPPGGTSQYGSPPAPPPQQHGPYTGPQQIAPLPQQQPQQNAPTLSDAVKAAHQEGQDFGESVARDAPALWLEAVLARKPRMPSDLEARLLQGSSLPIDFLLHDEVRHALRRGFWDALERSRR